MVIEGDETDEDLVSALRNLATKRVRCRDRDMKTELLADIDMVLDELLTRTSLKEP